MDVYVALQLLYDCALLGACGLALFRGGRDERLFAILMLASSAATAMLVAMPWFRWADDHWQILIIDALVLVGFGWIATVSDRFWPMWATAFQIDDVSVQAVMMAAPQRVRHAFVMLQGFWAYPILLAIVVGAYRSHRERYRSEIDHNE